MKNAPAPSEKASVVFPTLWVAGMALVLIPASRASYPLFHSLVELFSIVIACAVFTIAWNSRHIIANGYLLILGVASLFTGGLDLLHTLAYRGVELFPGHSGSDLATQLWIASRSLLALSLAAAPFFLSRRLPPVPLLGIYSTATLALLLSIFAWGAFPVCFIEGIGLTTFKVAAEYVISLLLTASLLLMWRFGTALDPGIRLLLSLFIGCNIAAELAFTAYSSPFAAANMIGHLLKTAGFTFLYQALLVTGLNRPFALLLRDLKASEEALRREHALVSGVVDASPAVIALLDGERKVVRYNRAMEQISGITSAQAAGLDWLATFVPAPDRDAHRRRMEQASREGTGGGDVYRLLGASGREMRVRMLFRPLPGKEGEKAGMLLVGLDMTESLRKEREREERIAALEAKLAGVRALEGMLPICTTCKKVRDEAGRWDQIEEYLARHSDARFSHGICPECRQRNVERLEKLKETKKEEKIGSSGK